MTGDVNMNNQNNTLEILTREEFLSLPKEQQRDLMAYWRENYPAKKIRLVLGYHNSTSFYNLLKRLDLPTNLSKTDEEEVSNDKQVVENIQKKLKNEPKSFEIHVSLIGDVDVDDLPHLLMLAKENKLEVKIENI